VEILQKQLAELKQDKAAVEQENAYLRSQLAVKEKNEKPVKDALANLATLNLD
jgi:cell division protein FtsB